MQIRFNLNQIGLIVECLDQGKWHTAAFFGNEKLESHGGVYAFKEKVLKTLYFAGGYDVTPAGTYHEENQTITCI